MDQERAPTRAAVLELKAERVVVEEAYDFLDEKRLLLAAELLKQLATYESLLAAVQAQTDAARQALAAAIKRHGLQGVSVYPVAAAEYRLQRSARNLMGVSVLDIELAPGAEAPVNPPASDPSVEAREAQDAFRKLLAQSALLAGVSGNLYRLYEAYRLTERRARALENVILPDIQATLAHMDAYLEEMDLEDAIRARPRGRGAGSA